MGEQETINESRYFLYKSSRQVKEVSINNKEILSYILDDVDNGECIEITRKIHLQEEYNNLKKWIIANCNYCGECDKCADLIYLGDKINFEDQAIEGALLLSSNSILPSKYQMF